MIKEESFGAGKYTITIHDETGKTKDVTIKTEELLISKKFVDDEGILVSVSITAVIKMEEARL